MNATAIIEKHFPNSLHTQTEINACQKDRMLCKHTVSNLFVVELDLKQENAPDCNVEGVGRIPIQL